MENVADSSDGNNGAILTLEQDGARHDSKVARYRPNDGMHYLLESVCPKQNDEIYGRPLPCFGCGIGWFLFILGFIFPLLWYFATVLYLGKYYLKDPRERPGLAASAIAALICSVAVFVALLALLFKLI